MKLFTLLSGAILGLLSVVFGAMGAHILKKILSQDSLHSFETAVKYQMYHAILLVVIGLYFNMENPTEQWISRLLVVGTIFFSWSIFALVIGKANGYNVSFLGPITPIGGLLLIVAWGLLAFLFWSTFRK